VIAIAFCSPEERGNLRDIERTTRQKIAVAPLPADFMAQAERLKRLKPAAVARPQQPSGNGHRRDGQRRDQRTDRQPHRAGAHPAHRPNGAQPNRSSRGRRRGGQRPQFARA
jgi:ATP-dependent RNA helicase RhlE